MKNAMRILMLAGLAALVVVGCSSDDRPGAPSGSSVVRWSETKAIGPAEIVLAFDVSDAVGGDDLAAMIEGAGSALADPDLVPADGSIAVAAVVYGDTVASPFAGLVPVTPENLTTEILPALNGLLDDRLVGGGAADLAEAMKTAGDLLAGGGAMDQHLLVMGTGAAADTAAVGTACTALDDAGVMVSGIALDEGAPLAACVAATGGWLAATVEDPGAAAAEALAYMLQADLDLTGSAVELARGAEFTALATFYRGGDADAYPLVGHDVTFTVVDGPNMGDPVTVATDTAGMAEIAYAGEGGPGTDVIVAEALHPGSGMALSDTVTVAWLNAEPECDTGGAYAAVVESDTVRIMLDGSASFDADGDSVSFAWTAGCDGAVFDDAASATPRLTLTGACLCVDTLTVMLEVFDGFSSSSCETFVTLDDRRPPVVETIDEPLMLWPPNHKHHAYTADMFVMAAEDACGRPLDLDAVEVLEVRSDEPDDARGDGRFTGDIAVTCPNTVMLRAERMGMGDGRVYTIVYRLTAENGEAVEFEGKVLVPHDQSGRPYGEDMAGGFSVLPDCLDD